MAELEQGLEELKVVKQAFKNNISANNVSTANVEFRDMPELLKQMEKKLPTQTKNVIPKTSPQTISADVGYKLDKVEVGAVTSSIDRNLIPTNIRKGTTILGVQGNLEADKPDQQKTVNPTTSTQVVLGDTGYELAKVTITPVTSSIDSNIKSSNIKEGISILGVVGSLKQSSGGSPKFEELVNGSILSLEESDISNISEIRPNAFANILSLTSVAIPSNITTIGANAFQDCSNLQTLTLAEGITTIGANAFDGTAITTLNIPTSIIEIGESTFANSSLSEITMESLDPPSVTDTTFPNNVTAIYVKYGAYESYLAEWSAYADKIVRLPAIPSTITVTVNNYLGELVSGTKVTISGNGQTYVGNTNEQGVFVQGDLQPATYTISVADLDGFKTPNNIEVVVNENTENVATVTYLEKPQGVIYGVRIALNNSNPSSSVEYTDEAVGYSGAYMNFSSSTFVDNGWKDRFPFNQIKPCLFKDGQVVKYLNPNNYEQDIDGNAVDITSGNAGDVMIEIPKIYYRLYSDDNYQYIQISNYLVDADKWCCYAHTYRGVEKDYLYLSAYEGSVLNSKLRSVSNKTPSFNLALGTYRNYAQANGNGYQLMSFNSVVLIQALYVIMFKNLNSQSALGYGNAQGQTTINNAGQTNTRGMYYGTSGNGSNKLFGVENIYGNIHTMVDGCFTDNNRNLVILNPIDKNCEFNNNGTNYLSIPTGITQKLDGYMKRVMGGNLTGFLPKEVSGSSTTYYCDAGYLDANGGLCLFGGTRWFDTFAGIFSVTVAYAKTYISEIHGSRIMYI